MTLPAGRAEVKEQTLLPQDVALLPVSLQAGAMLPAAHTKHSSDYEPLNKACDDGDDGAGTISSNLDHHYKAPLQPPNNQKRRYSAVAVWSPNCLPASASTTSQPSSTTVAVASSSTQCATQASTGRYVTPPGKFDSKDSMSLDATPRHAHSDSWNCRKR